MAIPKANYGDIKYLTPDNLYEQIKAFTSGMSVTKGTYELDVPKCTLEDFEWNHMDQMHRPSIHNTYDKGIRIAVGPNFAVSLTQWGKWPIFITVSDVYIAKGLFYQSLTLAGIVFLHSIISMEEIGNDTIRLKDEWYIASHKLLKWLHKPLNNKLYKLNARLQQEDEQLRQGRFALRKKGYTFQTDCPDYYNSNRLTNNTIYPILTNGNILSTDWITNEPVIRKVGDIEFIFQKDNDGTILIWPAVCPHEGGPLLQGKFCKNHQISCPWHGLRFSAVKLSQTSPLGTKYGFNYLLDGNNIHIEQIERVKSNTDVAEEMSILT